MLRLVAFLATTLVFVGVYLLGSTAESDPKEAEEFLKEFEDLVDGIDATGIFLHNAFIATIMFVPGVGVLWGLFSAWSTGYAFSVLTMSPEIADIPAISILLTPFGILELAAYSLAVSRSGLFVAMAIRRAPLVPQIRILLIEGGVAAALLAAAAVIEYVAIEAIQQSASMTMI